MPKKSAATHHPRVRTEKQIDDMLQQRQRMLVLLWELSKVDLKHIDESIKEMLDEFLGILVDYIAAGHFGLYQRLTEGSERRSAVVATAEHLYPRIAETTEAAVEFSERYETADERTINSRLSKDLSRLGEEVTTRIELEDKLIQAMMGSNVALSSAS